MSGHLLLRDLILVYVLALAAVIGLGRLRIPTVISLIVSGVVAGPHAFGLVSTAEEVDQLAEIGVVLLLFTVGLEFQVSELGRLWRTVAVAGAAQVAGTALVAGTIATMIGLPVSTGVFTGLFLALSSTAIVLKELGRWNRLDSPAGRITTGILLFQDVCVVAILLTAPMMAGTMSARDMPGVLGRALLAIAAIVTIARLVLPMLFRAVTACGQREAFPLAVLVASVGTAAIGASLGVSMAVGAFLAGLMLAGSEFSHQAHAEVRPLRDLLTSLFFISLGMLLDVSDAARNVGAIVALTAATILGKAIIGGGAVVLARSRVRIAAAVGVYLAQVGEFSFVLGRDAIGLGVLPQSVWSVLLPASILTMGMTPLLVGLGPRIGDLVAPRRPHDSQRPAETHSGGHVLVLGFGVGGRLIARSLREFGIPYRIIDLNGATVRQARTAGEPIIYGDATNADTLLAEGVERARAVVVVLSDPDAAVKIVRLVKRLAADVPVLVRARYRAEARRLQEAGAIAVAEELEASLEVLAQLMARLDVPGNIVEILIDGYRREEGLREGRRGARPVSLETLAHDILAAPVATHALSKGDWAADRSLAELNLRADTGASVLAVRRDDQYITSPPADLRLAAGDVLYLVGDDSDVLLARQRLASGPG